MSLDRLKEVIALVANSTIVELKYSEGDLHISLVRRVDGPSTDEAAAGAPALTHPRAAPSEAQTVPSPATAPAAPASADAAGTGDVLVTAPMASVFHRSPTPNAAPFVEVGGRCEPGDKLCILEAMKVFTVLNAEVAGTVIEILAADGEEVAAEQPLIRIRRG